MDRAFLSAAAEAAEELATVERELADMTEELAAQKLSITASQQRRSARKRNYHRHAAASSVDHGAFRVDFDLRFSEQSLERFTAENEAQLVSEIATFASVAAPRVIVRELRAGSVLADVSVVGFSTKAAAVGVASALSSAPPTDSFGPCIVGGAVVTATDLHADSTGAAAESPAAVAVRAAPVHSHTMVAALRLPQSIAAPLPPAAAAIEDTAEADTPAPAPARATRNPSQPAPRPDDSRGSDAPAIADAPQSRPSSSAVDVDSTNESDDDWGPVLLPVPGIPHMHSAGRHRRRPSAFSALFGSCDGDDSGTGRQRRPSAFSALFGSREGVDSPEGEDHDAIIAEGEEEEEEEEEDDC